MLPDNHPLHPNSIPEVHGGLLYHCWLMETRIDEHNKREAYTLEASPEDAALSQQQELLLMWYSRLPGVYHYLVP
ncbi:hypothetical protein D3C86_1318790 [compost metagenome]